MAKENWTRPQLLLAFKLYCQIPYGKLHKSNPEIIEFGELIGRTPSALAMKLGNIASLDPEIILTGRKGLTGASISDKTMWEEIQNNWGLFAIEIQKAEESFGIASDIKLILTKSLYQTQPLVTLAKIYLFNPLRVLGKICFAVPS